MLTRAFRISPFCHQRVRGTLPLLLPTMEPVANRERRNNLTPRKDQSNPMLYVRRRPTHRRRLPSPRRAHACNTDCQSHWGQPCKQPGAVFIGHAITDRRFAESTLCSKPFSICAIEISSARGSTNPPCPTSSHCQHLDAPQILIVWQSSRSYVGTDRPTLR